MSADPEEHELLEDTRILLPVGDLDVKAHLPVMTSSNNAYRILRETDAIRKIEGGSGRYLGMLSGPVTRAAGLGGRRAIFSVPSASTIAHELGHSMGLPHAPCGGVAHPDPLYPYPDGSIGAWGYDFRDGGGLVDPSTTDLMTYCGPPDWISDYNFSKALRFRLADEPDANAQLIAQADASLLLWGGMNAVGNPYLEPAFVVDSPPSLPNSAGEYAVAGRNEGGTELFSLAFTMPELPNGDGSSSFVFALPVEPGWAGSLASITLSGPGGSVMLDSNTDTPMSILIDPSTRQVRGILRDLPQADAAAALAPQAGPDSLDVLFSRGIPGAAAWGR